MRPLCFFIVVAALPVAAQTTQTSPAMGHLSGTVVNQSGDPISHARLCFGHFDEQAGHSSCGPEADDAGKFDLQVPIDTNRASAEKPSDGYWGDTNLAKNGQVVSLTAQKPSAHLTIKVGARPARINFSVVDKNTGAPVKNANIQIAQVEKGIGTRFTAFNQDSVAIPPDQDVLIMIEASGYRRWFYLDGAANQPTLRLQSGEERNVEADLEPAAKHN